MQVNHMRCNNKTQCKDCPHVDVVVLQCLQFREWDGEGCIAAESYLSVF